MWRMPVPILLLPAVLLAAVPYGLVAQPARPNASEWSFDVIKLKNGSVLKGLILEETSTAVRFQQIRRFPGRPTVWLTATLLKPEISSIDRLSEEARNLLRSRVRELDPTGESEMRRMEQLELQSIEWKGKAESGWRYESDYFTLVSNAPEEIVRRSAVRLEEVYTAYARFLPPRVQGGKPTTVMLFPTLASYRDELKLLGRKLKNPAFYEVKTNRIFCASDLQRLGEDLGQIRRQHAELRGELDRQELELRKLYAKKPLELARLLEAIKEYRKRITITDQKNDRIFAKETSQLFAMLYHEAFHAYVEGFVYPRLPGPPGADGLPGELPRWLNEGLAQIFEVAIVEAGELRVGHVSRDRLERVRECLRTGQLLNVRALLMARPQSFIVVHEDDRPGSDRTYLSCWALANYLCFDRRLLGTPELDRFVRSVNQKKDPVDAFETMVQEPLEAFEKKYKSWLMRLQVDGSLLDLPMKKQ